MPKELYHLYKFVNPVTTEVIWLTFLFKLEQKRLGGTLIARQLYALDPNQYCFNGMDVVYIFNNLHHIHCECMYRYVSINSRGYY